MESESGTGAYLSIGDFLAAEEPVWVWDAAARRILWANQAGRDFWGETSNDTLRAKPFGARNKSVARMGALAAQTDGKREWVETLTLAAASGRRPVRCYLQGLEVAGGRPGLIVKALSDTDGRAPTPQPGIVANTDASTKDRKRGAKSDRVALDAIAARLKKGAKPKPGLDRTPEALALSIRELSHELRNPLTVILGFAERIRDITPPGRVQERLRAYAADIIDSAHLALAILGDFSDRMLRPDCGATQPDPADIKIAVESCLRLIAPLAAQAGIKLSRRVGGNLPTLLAGERVLKQILLNILMNAVSHQKTGGQIKVTARRQKAGAVRLTVADDGRGMTKKEIKAVLGAARRKAPQPPLPGRSGLGLPLVRRLVEGAGGQLTIESARGKGTTIEIVF